MYRIARQGNPPAMEIAAILVSADSSRRGRSHGILRLAPVVSIEPQSIEYRYIGEWYCHQDGHCLRCPGMNWRIPQLPGKTCALLTILAVLAACVTRDSYKVRPLPNFVSVAIQPGDTVIVTTRSHETAEFEVTEVTESALHSAERQFKLTEITELRIIAEERPPTPCGGVEALGCSVPLLVSFASKAHASYKDQFYSACETHDYCYRHGFRTYGLDREFCDEEFLVNMQETCPRPSQSAIGTVLDALKDDLEFAPTCQEVANDFYLAVREFGDSRFQYKDSNYCEYNGPP